ncbi:hypothetical protein N7448_009831 [Penicillium atrosanguineum]|uniref:Uncharacterized protein n=1 Tax=Penicillium atrosanguineum TaxID=1132637 RepID=A0A9W9GLS9_9EURO|nr:Arginine--tRNA ligase cytoplasmic [Penicillium atrosanguineum]KAJ5123734.1 hypothetical protein N7448_009831 [Penicillium atrosanguineum]KAJ5142362.1 hypothetical protein N7526_003357 [Penicillium atrosanguineum]KAJ5298960.1 Arginine--tRNA ligase cytoplasmic [Penicillium atrosanguineum]KAJ5320777.1 hypothetical protein N7476_003779 [Penicillium atrosanguineum]
MHENTLIAVIIGVLMALILLGCAGWYLAKYRVNRAFKEDHELARDTEKGPNNTHIPRYNNKGWVRPPRKELVISKPNYVLIVDGDGHKIRRGGRLARELQSTSQGNGSQGQQRLQKNQEQSHGQSKHNKKNKQHNKDQKKNDQNSGNKESEGKKSEGKKNEDGSGHKANSHSLQAGQKHEKNYAWGVWDSDSPAKPDDERKSGSNKGKQDNQENQDQGNWNEQNAWNVDNQVTQDNHDQGNWDEQNKWHGDNEIGQNVSYQDVGSGNDGNHNKWNNELGPEDSISNQKRNNNRGDYHWRRNSRSCQESAINTSANNRNGGHRNSRTGWSSKNRRGLPPSDQGSPGHDKTKSNRSKNYDNAMSSQVPMDDQKKDEGGVTQEKW